MCENDPAFLSFSELKELEGIPKEEADALMGYPAPRKF
jgi:hypothetical protein